MLQARRIGGTRRIVVAFAMTGLLLALLAPGAAGAKIWGDVGDAPDSTNHHGHGMLPYPWSTNKAAFPTVYDPGTGLPQGPLHWEPLTDSWLGKHATFEADADLGYDEDGVDNIAPLAGKANQDGYDDGVIFGTSQGGIALPHCRKTNFSYVVTAPPLTLGHNAVVNVWVDFNRDGDWADTLTCQVSPDGPILRVAEWAVQNQVVGVTSGSHTVTTPTFVSANPLNRGATWLRITLSEQKAAWPTTGLPDGRGPEAGYRYGETEDYYLTLCRICTTSGIYVQ